MKQIIIKNNSQQGDVLFRKLGELPTGGQKLISRGRCVLAHGESGHSHVVEDEDAELIQIGERMILKLTKSVETTPATHEEHQAHHLSPGIWDIGRVQEYDYFSKMVQQVQD